MLADGTRGVVGQPTLGRNQEEAFAYLRRFAQADDLVVRCYVRHAGRWCGEYPGAGFAKSLHQGAIVEFT